MNVKFIVSSKWMAEQLNKALSQFSKPELVKLKMQHSTAITGNLVIGNIRIPVACATNTEIEIEFVESKWKKMQKVLDTIADQPVTITLDDSSNWITIGHEIIF